jgi:predicted nucleic-acid-binding Zn-ribbon protein
MKAILDFTTPDIYVATTDCKSCKYTLKYDRKSSLSSTYADEENVNNIEKNLQVYYPKH